MYKGTPARCFFQCVYLVISCKWCKGESRSNLFRVGLQNYFKQLIGNLSLLCAFKMLSCRNFRGPMYPLKIVPSTFFPMYPQKYEWIALVIINIAQSHIIHHAS